MQISGLRYIFIYRPDPPPPRYFLLCKSPRAGQTFWCKSRGGGGGMVTSQIDTCIMNDGFCLQFHATCYPESEYSSTQRKEKKRERILLSSVFALVNSKALTQGSHLLTVILIPCGVTCVYRLHTHWGSVKSGYFFFFFFIFRYIGQNDLSPTTIQHLLLFTFLGKRP